VTNSNTTPTDAPAMRFAGLCGAVVAVHPETPGWFGWICQGCGAGEGHQVEAGARKAANGHATICRSLPRD
jgi:hypothetical protein